MKAFLSISLAALGCILAAAWWVSTVKPPVRATAHDIRNTDGNPTVSRLNPAIVVTRETSDGRLSPLSWVPSDAEREDDQGAFAQWFPTDAERVDDRGATLTWIVKDAERPDDNGHLLTWTASDFERAEDAGARVVGWGLRG